jgi:hypothetical protein
VNFVGKKVQGVSHAKELKARKNSWKSGFQVSRKDYNDGQELAAVSLHTYISRSVELDHHMALFRRVCGFKAV